MKTQYGRYMLLIKQCVQLTGYTDDENQSEQMIAILFSSDDQSKVSNAAKQLSLLQSNTHMTIYDQVTGKRAIVQ